MNYKDLIDALNENTRELKNMQELMPYLINGIHEPEKILRVKSEMDKLKEGVFISADLIFDMTEDEW